jgi:hypothetical protein
VLGVLGMLVSEGAAGDRGVISWVRVCRGSQQEFANDGLGGRHLPGTM